MPQQVLKSLLMNLKQYSILARVLQTFLVKDFIVRKAFSSPAKGRTHFCYVIPLALSQDPWTVMSMTDVNWIRVFH